MSHCICSLWQITLFIPWHELQSCLVLNEAGKSPASQCCLIVRAVCKCRGVLLWPQMSIRRGKRTPFLGGLIKEMKSNSVFKMIRIIWIWLMAHLSCRAVINDLLVHDQCSIRLNYLTELQLLQSHCSGSGCACLYIYTYWLLMHKPNTGCFLYLKTPHRM